MNKRSNHKSLKQKFPISCVWGIMCSMSSVDQTTNNVSLFNILETFTLPLTKKELEDQLKVKNPLNIRVSYQVVLFLKRLIDIKISNEEKHADLKIKTINPEGKVVSETAFSFVFIKGKQNMRLILDINGMVVDKPGLYLHKFEIKASDNKDFFEIYETPFQVMVRE